MVYFYGHLLMRYSKTAILQNQAVLINLNNMQPHEKVLPGNILYSCYSHKSSEGEQFVPMHVFTYVIAGTNEIYLGNQHYFFKPGDFRFIRKNQLARYTKHPPENGEFKSISIKFDQETLQAISEELNSHADGPYTGGNAVALPANELYTSFIHSLSPYMNPTHVLSDTLNRLKVKEAVLILLETQPSLKNVLFDFSEPGKIDLEAYMNAHYRYNVQLNRFAYLTGRSLATFKRDFERIFHESPSRWLQLKRLEEAHYLISEKKKKPSEVYMEVGFEDLSHFSFAFKKQFGVSPSALIA